MTSTHPRTTAETPYTSALLGVDIAAAIALAAATIVFHGTPLEVDDDIVVSVLLLCVGLAGLYQLRVRGMLSFLSESAGVLLGLWLVGTSFDFGADHRLMWAGVVVGTVVFVTHVALARLGE